MCIFAFGAYGYEKHLPPAHPRQQQQHEQLDHQSLSVPGALQKGEAEAMAHSLFVETRQLWLPQARATYNQQIATNIRQQSNIGYNHIFLKITLLEEGLLSQDAPRTSKEVQC